MKKAKITYPVENFSRYKFTAEGECFNDATGDPVQLTDVVTRPAYRIYRDDGKRVIMYVTDIVAAVKAGMQPTEAPVAVTPVQGLKPRPSKYVQQVGRGSRPTKPEAPKVEEYTEKDIDRANLKNRYLSDHNLKVLRHLATKHTYKELAVMFERDRSSISRTIGNKMNSGA